MVNVVIALLPVIAFLAALWFMDRFGMVEPRSIAALLLYGAACAAVALWMNDTLVHSFGIPRVAVREYFAPLLEESVKAALLCALIASGRVGFLVDAALQGFAIGTGFALFENLWYLQTMPHASLALWIVRGLGTAILQGATTTLFGIVSQALATRNRHRLWLAFVPGWLLAVVLHATYNHRILPPVAEMLMLLIAVPLLVLFTYDYSERATREWVGAGLDLDIEILGLMTSDAFMLTQFGRRLQELRATMPAAVIADMYCLLRLELELSVQAKALLLAREAGLLVPVSEDLEATLAERRALKAAIGKAGLAAIAPLQVTSYRDTWHRHLLKHRRPALSPGV